MTFSRILIGLIVVAAAIGGVVYGMNRKPSSTTEPVVRIGYLQIVAGLPAHVMRHEQYLEKAGVAYELVPYASSNEAYDALVRGDLDIMAGMSYLPVFLNEPKQSGLVKLFRPFDLTTDGYYDVMIVKKDSPIKTIKDVAGKNIGVYPGSTLTNFTKYYLGTQGVDMANTKLTQLTPATLLPALEAGSIDAAIAYQPNAIIALESGAYRELEHDIYAKSFDHSPIGGAAIRAKFLNDHPALAEKAYAGVEAAYQFMQDHPNEARTILADFLKLDPVLAQKVPLPAYSQVYDSAHVQKLIGFLREIGEMQDTVDAGSLRYR